MDGKNASFLLWEASHFRARASAYVGEETKKGVQRGGKKIAHLIAISDFLVVRHAS
jgi:hypothetical protein